MRYEDQLFYFCYLTDKSTGNCLLYNARHHVYKTIEDLLPASLFESTNLLQVVQVKNELYVHCDYWVASCKDDDPDYQRVLLRFYELGAGKEFKFEIAQFDIKRYGLSMAIHED